jgi:hypothetical protein
VSGRGQSALAGLDARLSPAPAVAAPRVSSFHQFLAEVARVRVQSGHAAGTYAPYSFQGRAALVEVVHCIDHVLGSHTCRPLKDARVALAGGAQFGKTTLELNLAAYVAACRFLNPIVYLPDDQLAADIVDAKFRPDVIDQVGWFAQMTRVGRAVNESGKAVNTKGAFLVTDGQRKAVGMFRGLQKPPTSFTADVVIEDEKDDIKPAMAKYVSGRMTASQMRFHLEIGTQRVHGSGQNKVWKRGSQGVVLLASAATWARTDPREVSAARLRPRVCGGGAAGLREPGGGLAADLPPGCHRHAAAGRSTARVHRRLPPGRRLLAVPAGRRLLLRPPGDGRTPRWRAPDLAPPLAPRS